MSVKLLQLFSKFLFICYVKLLEKNCTHLLQVVNQCCVVHIKKETNEWYPQSHVTSLNSLILTVKFPLGAGCIAAEAIAIFNNCFNYNYFSMPSSVVRTFFLPRNTC